VRRRPGRRGCLSRSPQHDHQASPCAQHRPCPYRRGGQ
jgi:hypothetical protein